MSAPPRASLAAALVLSAGTLAWLLVPSPSVGADPLNVTGRFGCDEAGSFVEVTIGNPTPGASYEIGMLPVGKAAGTDPSAASVPDALTAPDEREITVRLAQSVAQGGDAYLKVMATGDIDVVVLPDTCHESKPRIPQLATPGLTADLASSGACAGGSVAGNQVAIVTSVNVPDGPTKKYLRASGLPAIFYNLALVDVKAGRVVDSNSVSFASAATGTSCLVAPRRVGTYQVQAIGTDGTSTSTHLLQVSIPPSGPVSAGPPPKPPIVAPPAPPASPSTGPTVHPTPGASGSVGPRPSPAATGQEGTAGTGGTVGTAPSPTQAPAAGSTEPSGPGARPTGPAPSGQARGGPPSGAIGSGQGSSNGRSIAQTVPTPSAARTDTLRLAEPPLDGRSTIFVWQAWEALIVLGYALMTGALVVTVVRQAGRR